jgi:beta-mannosidase
MKKSILSIFLWMIMMMTSLQIQASAVTLTLDKGWQFRQVRLSNWHPATVPGTVQTDLMACGLLDDPFFRLNERGAQWVDKEDWIYENRFDLPAELKGRSHVEVCFNGLDTYADVKLNGTSILSADNMFRRWTADVTKLLRDTGNVLTVYFHSPTKKGLEAYDASPIKYAAANDQSENGGLFGKKVSPFTRKAGYHYGWDWGPRLVTIGIWRPVVLTAWDKAVVRDTWYRQPSVTPQLARLTNTVTIDADSPMKDVELTVTDGGKLLAKKRISLRAGANIITLPFDIKNPHLWWSNGLGQPYLYALKTTLRKGGELIGEKTEKVGVRSLRFVADKDSIGRSCYFELNGKKVFMKGADYIPNDNFLPRVTADVYNKVVNAAAGCNMNMLRVWGGGIYEDDYFYQLCDEKGILVWQDFMFACGLYPGSGAYLDNVAEEAKDNIIRLRNHPCIALWCGNNECQDGWYNWGWKRQYEKLGQADKVWQEYKNIFYDVLPKAVKDYDPDVAYWPSSPFGDYGHGSNDHEGDRHYWEVWHGKKPVSNYNHERARFFSEYGMQSFPEFATVEKFAPDSADWNIYSDVMMAHQRGGEHANGLIETYLVNEYHEPRDFRQQLYLGQLLQGDAMKTAIESHRRQKGYCWGTLFWQINDCWPVASWSSIDYYGRWKAAQYMSRKAYDDILVSPIEQDGKLAVYVVNDRQQSVRGTLTVSLMDMSGRVLRQEKKDATVAANVSASLWDMPVDQFLGQNDKSKVFVHAVFHADKDYDNNYELLLQKQMQYPDVHITTTVAPVKGGMEVTLRADAFARAVCLSIEGIDNFFSDNYFDLIPGEKKTVMVTTALPLDEFKKQLTVTSFK